MRIAEYDPVAMDQIAGIADDQCQKAVALVNRDVDVDGQEPQSFTRWLKRGWPSTNTQMSAMYGGTLECERGTLLPVTAESHDSAIRNHPANCLQIKRDPLVGDHSQD